MLNYNAMQNNNPMNQQKKQAKINRPTGGVSGTQASNSNTPAIKGVSSYKNPAAQNTGTYNTGTASSGYQQDMLSTAWQPTFMTSSGQAQSTDFIHGNVTGSSPQSSSTYDTGTASGSGIYNTGTASPGYQQDILSTTPPPTFVDSTGQAHGTDFIHGQATGPLANALGGTQMPTTGTQMPNTTTGMPNTITGMPNTTTGMPNTITGMPNTITGMPNTITGMPNTTTGMPNTTTGMPNTTTGMPTTAPTTGAPTTGMPTTAPTTGMPTTAPTTGMPTTAPTTGAPTTGMPTTAPTTEPTGQTGDGFFTQIGGSQTVDGPKDGDRVDNVIGKDGKISRSARIKTSNPNALPQPHEGHKWALVGNGIYAQVPQDSQPGESGFHRFMVQDGGLYQWNAGGSGDTGSTDTGGLTVGPGSDTGQPDAPSQAPQDMPDLGPLGESPQTPQDLTDPTIGQTAMDEFRDTVLGGAAEQQNAAAQQERVRPTDERGNVRDWFDPSEPNSIQRVADHTAGDLPSRIQSDSRKAYDDFLAPYGGKVPLGKGGVGFYWDQEGGLKPIFLNDAREKLGDGEFAAAPFLGKGYGGQYQGAKVWSPRVKQDTPSRTPAAELPTPAQPATDVGSTDTGGLTVGPGSDTGQPELPDTRASDVAGRTAQETPSPQTTGDLMTALGGVQQEVAPETTEEMRLPSPEEAAQSMQMEAFPGQDANTQEYQDFMASQLPAYEQPQEVAQQAATEPAAQDVQKFAAQASRAAPQSALEQFRQQVQAGAVSDVEVPQDILDRAIRSENNAWDKRESELAKAKKLTPSSDKFLGWRGSFPTFQDAQGNIYNILGNGQKLVLPSDSSGYKMVADAVAGKPSHGFYLANQKRKSDEEIKQGLQNRQLKMSDAQREKQQQEVEERARPATSEEIASAVQSAPPEEVQNLIGTLGNQGNIYESKIGNQTRNYWIDSTGKRRFDRLPDDPRSSYSFRPITASQEQLDSAGKQLEESKQKLLEDGIAFSEKDAKNLIGHSERYGYVYQDGYKANGVSLPYYLEPGTQRKKRFRGHPRHMSDYTALELPRGFGKHADFNVDPATLEFPDTGPISLKNLADWVTDANKGYVDSEYQRKFGGSYKDIVSRLSDEDIKLLAENPSELEKYTRGNWDPTQAVGMGEFHNAGMNTVKPIIQLENIRRQEPEGKWDDVDDWGSLLEDDKVYLYNDPWVSGKPQRMTGEAIRKAVEFTKGNEKGTQWHGIWHDAFRLLTTEDGQQAFPANQFLDGTPSGKTPIEEAPIEEPASSPVWGDNEPDFSNMDFGAIEYKKQEVGKYLEGIRQNEPADRWSRINEGLVNINGQYQNYESLLDPNAKYMFVDPNVGGRNISSGKSIIELANALPDVKADILRLVETVDGQRIFSPESNAAAQQEKQAYNQWVMSRVRNEGLAQFLQADLPQSLATYDKLVQLSEQQGLGKDANGRPIIGTLPEGAVPIGRSTKYKRVDGVNRQVIETVYAAPDGALLTEEMGRGNEGKYSVSQPGSMKDSYIRQGRFEYSGFRQTVDDNYKPNPALGQTETALEEFAQQVEAGAVSGEAEAGVVQGDSATVVPPQEEKAPDPSTLPPAQDVSSEEKAAQPSTALEEFAQQVESGAVSEEVPASDAVSQEQVSAVPDRQDAGADELYGKDAVDEMLQNSIAEGKIELVAGQGQDAPAQYVDKKTGNILNREEAFNSVMGFHGLTPEQLRQKVGQQQPQQTEQTPERRSDAIAEMEQGLEQDGVFDEKPAVQDEAPDPAVEARQKAQQERADNIIGYFNEIPISFEDGKVYATVDGAKNEIGTSQLGQFAKVVATGGDLNQSGVRQLSYLKNMWTPAGEFSEAFNPVDKDSVYGGSQTTSNNINILKKREEDRLLQAESFELDPRTKQMDEFTRWQNERESAVAQIMGLEYGNTSPQQYIARLSEQMAEIGRQYQNGEIPQADAYNQQSALRDRLNALQDALEVNKDKLAKYESVMRTGKPIEDDYFDEYHRRRNAPAEGSPLDRLTKIVSGINPDTGEPTRPVIEESPDPERPVIEERPDPERPVIEERPADQTALEEFKDQVEAGAVSDPEVGQQPVSDEQRAQNQKAIMDSGLFEQVAPSTPNAPAQYEHKATRAILGVDDALKMLEVETQQQQQSPDANVTTPVVENAGDNQAGRVEIPEGAQDSNLDQAPKSFAKQYSISDLSGGHPDLTNLGHFENAAGSKSAHRVMFHRDKDGNIYQSALHFARNPDNADQFTQQLTEQQFAEIKRRLGDRFQPPAPEQKPALEEFAEQVEAGAVSDPNIGQQEQGITTGEYQQPITEVLNEVPPGHVSFPAPMRTTVVYPAGSPEAIAREQAEREYHERMLSFGAKPTRTGGYAIPQDSEFWNTDEGSSYKRDAIEHGYWDQDPIGEGNIDPPEGAGYIDPPEDTAPGDDEFVPSWEQGPRQYFRAGQYTPEQQDLRNQYRDMLGNWITQMPQAPGGLINPMQLMLQGMMGGMGGQFNPINPNIGNYYNPFLGLNLIGSLLGGGGLYGGGQNTGQFDPIIDNGGSYVGGWSTPDGWRGGSDMRFLGADPIAEGEQAQDAMSIAPQQDDPPATSDDDEPLTELPDRSTDIRDIVGTDNMIEVNPGFTREEITRRDVSPADVQAMANQAAAQARQQGYEQSLRAGMPGRGRSSDAGTFSQFGAGPLAQSLLQAQQAQIAIPFEQQMAYNQARRQREQAAHQLGLAQSGLIGQDYYRRAYDQLADQQMQSQLMQALLNPLLGGLFF